MAVPGKPKSFVEGIQHAIHMYVFDGKPLDMKKQELAKRSSSFRVHVLFGAGVKEDIEKYRNVPLKVEHYGYMVDLLGRNGPIDMAHEIIEQYPSGEHYCVRALLAACKLHKNMRLGK
ncbi:hypothetical protein IFM89_015830 [Coptis chinensis]|uniref:Uncharacterized protein n=1 Tax=Coptis chinensis TaxID=261450 RepID=A0A835M626_9MAGN|nr:hypothetical protein IFM89_015830 [Coptis chinensis]